MKNTRLFLMLFLCTLASISFAQVADLSENISPLLIGEKIPDIEMEQLDGQKSSINKIIAEKPAILIFYRGGWCPYCNRHLSAVGEVESEILDLGYQIIGIAPDKIEELQTTVEKNELKYTLLSDADGALSEAAGIAFKAPSRYDKKLSKYSGDQNPGILPVPAIFIVNKQSEILFEYINPNYKKRMTAEMLLAVLNSLEQE